MKNIAVILAGGSGEFLHDAGAHGGHLRTVVLAEDGAMRK